MAKTSSKKKTKSHLPTKLSKAPSAFPTLGKIQLSLLNSGLLPAGDDAKASSLIPKKPLEPNKFAKHVALLRKYDVLLRTEFQVATKGEAHSCRHATKPANESKNSNKKFLPYDYNRVVLEHLPGIPESDYINASYIDSILKPNAYIATQGPTEATVADFWRMVWEQKSKIIVMLTKVFDFIRVMCVRYWPVEPGRVTTYGDIEVTTVSEESLANYFIRTIRMRRGDEERTVIHMHYVNWPIHACPYSNALLDFRRRVRIYMAANLGGGPVIVHCSDGCGRTGTYLCLDANLELLEEDNTFDVFNYTKKLRQARKGLVENVDHYKFIYETLLEFHICGKTWFPVTELSQQMKYKSMKSSVTRQNEYQREYQKICKLDLKMSIGDCAGGHRPENREKNRDISIVPPDNFRPYLSSFQSNDSTDYINAVFVDGYTRSKEFIVTEWPMVKFMGIGDLWSLVYDHDCNSIIVLGSPPPSNNYPQFWPTEKEKRKKFGPVFTIEVMSHNHYANLKTWIFRIEKKRNIGQTFLTSMASTPLSKPKPQPRTEPVKLADSKEVVSLTELMAGVKAFPKTTQLFQITCWPQGHKVPTSTNALVEMMNMVERWRQRTNYGPVAVISPNGKSRAGVYCAASSAIEQVVQHGEVDVFQAVRTVRRHRPQLVENMTEYKYCYDLVLHYILYYLNQE